MSRSAFPPASDRCTRYAPVLLTLFDGQTLDVALLELNDARAHLHECAACRKQWRDWELTRDALRATTPHPPEGLGQRVTLAVRLRAPFESVPTPPPGLRDAILRATIGVRNAVQACNPDAADDETNASAPTVTDAVTNTAVEGQNSAAEGASAQARASAVEMYEPLSQPAMPTEMPALHIGASASQSRRARRAARARTTTAWLTPALAAWLILLGTKGSWNGTRPDIELPTVHTPTSLRNTARSVKAKASRVLNRLHLGGVAHSAATALRGESPKATSTATTPSDADAGNPDAADTDATPRAQPAPRGGSDEWREIAHREIATRRDREDERPARDDRRDDDQVRPDHDEGPRFQLAGWHPTRPIEAPEPRVEVSEQPVRRTVSRIAAAPSLSSVPERRMNGARGGTQLATTGLEDSPRTVPGRTLTLPSRFGGGRRLNVMVPTRGSGARLNTTRFAPNQVASPQLVSRIPVSDAPDESLTDTDTPPLRLSDHRPAEISQVMDDFRAALDEEE